MDAKKLTAALAEKMQAEQDKYRTWLLSQPPAEILNHTYEYTIRQDILIALEDHDLTAAQAETLLASSAPLADIYRDWCKRDDPQYMEDIQDTIKARADDLIQREEEIRKSPVYKYPFDYAKENGELDQYRASHQANIACKQAIENEISNRHDGFSFDCKAAVHAVVKKFGYDRTLYVLAATVRDKEHDGRFSYKNKDWARTMVLRSFRCLDMKKAASHLPGRGYERRSCADIRFFSTYHACPPLENLDFPILSEVTLSNLSF